ncbi:MAG: acyl carrier protein [Planctomycetota bacterium]|nr:acyl carrier protein [Planctomycetota bacterium]MDA1213766.1 acyl carrier protein [Planctomycetota bacterium]
MTHDEIYDKVKDILVDALSVDDEDVSPNAKLMADLGAESIDFLDIVFRLEKNFNIKIERGELFPDPETFASPDTGFVKEGTVTPAGLDEIRKKLPHASAEIDVFAKDPQVSNVQDLITVDMIVKFIVNKTAG